MAARFYRSFTPCRVLDNCIIESQFVNYTFFTFLKQPTRLGGSTISKYYINELDMILLKVSVVFPVKATLVDLRHFRLFRKTFASLDRFSSKAKKKKKRLILKEGTHIWFRQIRSKFRSHQFFLRSRDRGSDQGLKIGIGTELFWFS